MSKLDFKCFNKCSIMYLALTLISIWYKEMSLHADELRISLFSPKISLLYLQRLKCCTFPKLRKINERLESGGGNGCGNGLDFLHYCLTGKLVLA